MDKPNLPQCLSELELSRQLGKHPKTVANWRLAGLGPAVTWVGRSPHYLATAVESWLAAGGTRASRRRGRR
jgi:hypothetical protein